MPHQELGRSVSWNEGNALVTNRFASSKSRNAISPSSVNKQQSTSNAQTAARSSTVTELPSFSTAKQLFYAVDARQGKAAHASSAPSSSNAPFALTPAAVAAARAVQHLVNVRTATTVSSQHEDDELTPDQAKKLRLYLMTSLRSIAKLQIVDIVGEVDEEGNRSEPLVRRGKIVRTKARRKQKDALNPGPSKYRYNYDSSKGDHGSSGDIDSIPCCMVGAFPFERCELVATVVKKHITYRSVKHTIRVKGKGKAKPGAEEVVEVLLDEVSKIYYELDDASGAIITCHVSAQKVYPNFHADDSDAEEGKDGQRGQFCPSSVGQTHSTPTSDPRLWIYRYHKPPEPVKTEAGQPTPYTTPPPPTVPIYSEGTVVRVVGNIVIRRKARQLDALKIEELVPSSFTADTGERRRFESPVDAKKPVDKYAEWHHAVQCKSLKWDLYLDRRKVREWIDLEGKGKTGKSLEQLDGQTNEDGSQRYHDASASFNTTAYTDLNASSASLGSSLLDDSTATTLSSISTSSASRAAKTPVGKLPSLETLHAKKVPITKERFLLYVHEHFRKRCLSKRGSAFIADENNNSNNLLGMIHCDNNPHAAKTLLSYEPVKLTLRQLQDDKKLDWLAHKCAKLEAMQLLALHQGESTGTSAVSQSKPTGSLSRLSGSSSSIKSSTILPGSSPNRLSAISSLALKSPRGRTSGKDGLLIRSEYIAKRKSGLFVWAIKKLREDGAIVIFLPDLEKQPDSGGPIFEGTPRQTTSHQLPVSGTGGSVESVRDYSGGEDTPKASRYHAAPRDGQGQRESRSGSSHIRSKGLGTIFAVTKDGTSITVPAEALRSMKANEGPAASTTTTAVTGTSAQHACPTIGQQIDGAGDKALGTSRSTGASARPPVSEEAYSLVTPQLIAKNVLQTSPSSSSLSSTYNVRDIQAILRRDEMWRYVADLGMMQEALGLLQHMRQVDPR